MTRIHLFNTSQILTTKGLNKIHCYILFLLFTFYQVSAQKLENKTWISIKTDFIRGANGGESNDGLILSFKDGELKLSHIFSDTTAVVHYRRRGQRLKLTSEFLEIKNELFGKIKHLDSDSMWLETDRHTRLTFVPIGFTDVSGYEPGFWDHTNWIIENQFGTQELKLLDMKWHPWTRSTSKIAVVRPIIEKYRWGFNERWAVKRLENSHLFLLTIGQFDRQFMEVIRYFNDSVILKDLSNPDSEDIILRKTKKISKAEQKEIASRIQDKIWYTNKLVGIFGENEDDDYGSGGFTVRDTTFFQKNSLSNNNLVFEFRSDSKYQIFEKEELRIEGVWRISDDGKHIVLDSGAGPSAYIDIIQLNEGSLTIGKQDLFQSTERKRDYVELYYISKLSIKPLEQHK